MFYDTFTLHYSLFDSENVYKFRNLNFLVKLIIIIMYHCKLLVICKLAVVWKKIRILATYIYSIKHKLLSSEYFYPSNLIFIKNNPRKVVDLIYLIHI